MSIVAPISGTAAVVPVVAGIVTGERPSAAQAAGIGLAVVGVVLASRAQPADGGRRESRGRRPGFVAALAFGSCSSLSARRARAIRTGARSP